MNSYYTLEVAELSTSSNNLSVQTVKLTAYRE